MLVINKMDTAEEEKVNLLMDNIRRFNPTAKIIRANSPVTVDGGEEITGKNVLVVEDGPTLTHGEMTYGAGIVAANKFGAGSVIDPRPYAVGSIKDTFAKYSHLDKVLPAMGYGDQQVAELEETINKCDCDLVVSGTPIDLNRLIKSDKKILRVRYDIEEIGSPDLDEILREF